MVIKSLFIYDVCIHPNIRFEPQDKHLCLYNGMYSAWLSMLCFSELLYLHLKILCTPLKLSIKLNFSIFKSSKNGFAKICASLNKSSVSQDLVKYISSKTSE